MKKKVWKIVFALLGVFVFIWLILTGLITKGSAGDVTQLAKINEMAQHLNDKYGYSVSAVDCVYFREEDYSFQTIFTLTFTLWNAPSSVTNT